MHGASDPLPGQKDHVDGKDVFFYHSHPDVILHWLLLNKQLHQHACQHWSCEVGGGANHQASKCQSNLLLLMPDETKDVLIIERLALVVILDPAGAESRTVTM